MRIISKFKDYYDCIQAYGHDDYCIFQRVKNKTTIDNFEYPVLNELVVLPLHFETNSSEINIKIKWLLYCGNLIPFLMLKAKDAYDGSGFYLYDINDVGKLFSFIEKEYGIKERTHIESMFNSNKKNKDCIYAWRFHFYKHDVKRLFEMTSILNSSDILLNAEVPIGILNKKKGTRRYYDDEINHRTRIKWELNTNPTLSAIQFYKHKHNLEAFTDIENYITQQLGGNSPTIIEVSNKNKIVKHGFDLKTSFRKPKQRK